MELYLFSPYAGAHSDNFHAEVTGVWRKLRNEELYNLYSLSYLLLCSSTEGGKMDGTCTKYRSDKILHNTLTGM